MKPQTFHLNIFADYHMLYLYDVTHQDFDIPNLTNESINEFLTIVTEDFFIIHTIRNMTVPVSVEVQKQKPKIDLKEWDHINECGLKLNSGKFYLHGTTDLPEDGFSLELPQGYYGINICYKKLSEIIYDGLEGNDSYTIYIWLEDKYLPKRVIKQWIDPRK